jgi:magnesium transporter
MVHIVRWSPRDGTTRHEGADAVAPALADPDARVWIDLVDPTGDQVAAVAEALGLHPLIAEDIEERNQRAKVELTDDLLHIVLFAVAYAGETQLSEVDLVLGTRFLVSAHDEGYRPDQGSLQRRGGEPALARGPDFVLWAICDAIVDGYFPVLDRIEDELDQLQDDVLDRPRGWTLQRVFRTKRELIELRRAIAPAREVFNQLTNRELDLVRPEQVLYFRDVYDHLIRVTDELDTDRELVAGTLDVYLTSVNNELSAIMKRLTGVTVILAGIGAIAGIFGMSEAGTEAGSFWLVSGFIALLAAGTALFLRRIDWI